MAKKCQKTSVKTARHITLPFRHIKAIMRTGKTGKAPTCFHKKTCEIFWQAVSDNLHFWPYFVAKSKTKMVSPIRKFVRIPLVGWQGITAKTADNYDKAHTIRERSAPQAHQCARGIGTEGTSGTAPRECV